MIRKVGKIMTGILETKGKEKGKMYRMVKVD